MRARPLVVLALLVIVAGLTAVLVQRSRFEREAFAPGDRVRVVAASARAANATGTVTLPPLPIVGDEAGWVGHVRRRPGAEPAFWVALDRPLARADAPPLRGLELPASQLVPR